MLLRVPDQAPRPTVHLDYALLLASTTERQYAAAFPVLKAHGETARAGAHRVTFWREGVNGITCDTCQAILLEAWAH